MPAKVKSRREDRDYEDLVRLYLEDVGLHDLLTKDDEIRLAQAIEAGIEARTKLETTKKLTPTQRRQLRRDDPPGRRGAPPVRELEPAARRVDRQEVPVVGSAAARHRAGGQPRPDPRRRQVRLAQGLQVLDVRDVVDPPGDPARHRELGARHPAPRPRRRHAHRAAQAARPARGHAGPHADAGRAGRRGRAAAREGRRSAPLRGRHGLARRARPRRRRRRARRLRRGPQRGRAVRPRGHVAAARRDRQGARRARRPRDARSSRCASASTVAASARSRKWPSTSVSPASGSARSRPGRCRSCGTRRPTSAPASCSKPSDPQNAALPDRPPSGAAVPRPDSDGPRQPRWVASRVTVACGPSIGARAGSSEPDTCIAASSAPEITTQATRITAVSRWRCRCVGRCG